MLTRVHADDGELIAGKPGTTNNEKDAKVLAESMVIFA